MRRSFTGFRGPNYTPVPDELFDELLPDLTLAELRVLLYVMRRTFGFKKGSDRISKSQLESGIVKRDGQLLDRGTGLSRRAVRVAIHSLVEKGILLKRSRFSNARGHEATEYALNIIGQDPWVENTQGGADPGVQSTQASKYQPSEASGMQRSTQALGTVVPPQETVTKRFNNVNVLQKSDTNRPDDADARAHALALDILDVCKDKHSMGSYLQIARTYPEHLIREALSLTKDHAARGRIRQSKGAYFTGLVSRLDADNIYRARHQHPPSHRT